MHKTLVLFAILASTAPRAQAQPAPVIDMHMHALGPTGTAAMVAAMDSLNVRTAIFLGTQSALANETSLGGGRLIPSLTLPCASGKLPTSGAPCFDNGAVFPDLAWLRSMIARGDVRALGEINAEYLGISPDDSRLEPYYSLAEELGIPVGIHLGIGAPGVAYAGPSFPPVKSPDYSGLAGDPRLLEPVLVRHPELRLYVMHAAWPYLDAMTYMLYMHPRLYVDISVLQYAVPRAAYYRYLHALVDAGFGKRIMFGSDGSGRRLREGILAIQEAPFLTELQKRDILYDNAARFLKL